MDELWGPQSLAAFYCIPHVMDINYQFKSINCIQDLEGQYSSYKLTTILHPTEHHIFYRHHKISIYSLVTFNLGLFAIGIYCRFIKPVITPPTMSVDKNE